MTKTKFWLLIAIVSLPLLCLTIHQILNPGQESLGFVLRELFSLWVSVVVGGVVAWYTWETQRLRKSAEEQVCLLKDQLDQSREQARKATLPEIEVKILDPERSQYRLVVTNCGDHAARWVSPFFRKAGNSEPTWFVQGENAPFDLMLKNADNKGDCHLKVEPSGAAQLAGRYKISEPCLLAALGEVAKEGQDGQSVAGVLFYDIEYRLYLTGAAVTLGNSVQQGHIRTIGPIV